MLQAIRRGNGEELHLTADADYADGYVVNKSGFAGIVEGPVVNGDPMNVRIAGAYDILSASGTTFAAGALVEWNDTTKLAVASGAGDFVLGMAGKAKVSGELVVRVILNHTPLAPV
jgi:predicted RecA/RadA family phage recombinase